MSSFFDSVFDILFPSLCLKCGANIGGREILCRECFRRIPVNNSFFCGKCGARLPFGQKICHFDFPYVLGAATAYKNELARILVKELKFNFAKNAAAPLAELVIAYAKNACLPDGGWLVVPIPLGKKRLRRRGFNQAELIAGIFSERFSMEIGKGMLERTKETEPQSEIGTWESRLKNTENCFSAALPEKLAGRNVILIDDVSTSGATFLEAAWVLKKAGVKKIIALAAARG